jgi:carbon monoxide dehydrogenase subunit G
VASIHREVRIAADPESVWDALRDVAAAIAEMMDQGLAVIKRTLETNTADRNL